jgi:hypothetical protein
MFFVVSFFFYKIREQEGGTCSALVEGRAGTVGVGRWGEKR